jgi:hypothetical protein
VAGDLYDDTPLRKGKRPPDPSKLSESVRGTFHPGGAEGDSDGVAKAVDASELEKKATEMLSSYTGAMETRSQK